jgi:hypothetical protein
VSGSQLLNRRLHLAGFRLVQAGELDEQAARRICLEVASEGCWGDVARIEPWQSL